MEDYSFFLSYLLQAAETLLAFLSNLLRSDLLRSVAFTSLSSCKVQSQVLRRLVSSPLFFLGPFLLPLQPCLQIPLFSLEEKIVFYRLFHYFSHMKFKNKNLINPWSKKISALITGQNIP